MLDSVDEQAAYQTTDPSMFQYFDYAIKSSSAQELFILNAQNPQPIRNQAHRGRFSGIPLSVFIIAVDNPQAKLSRGAPCSGERSGQTELLQVELV